MFDYVCLTGTTENRMCEYVDHLHDHFVNPPIMGNSRHERSHNIAFFT